MQKEISNLPTKNIRNATFHYIADIINPTYEDLGYIDHDIDENEINTKIYQFIDENKLQFGDILFTGSTYETRQYYGFVMVNEDKTFLEGENGCYLPFDRGIYKKLSGIVKYKKLFEDMVKNEKANYIFFDYDYKDKDLNWDEAVDAFKKENMWD